jgi:hypothetical protein
LAAVTADEGADAPAAAAADEGAAPDFADNRPAAGTRWPRTGARSAISSVLDIKSAESFGRSPAVCTSTFPDRSLDPKLPLRSSTLNRVPSTDKVAARRYFGVLGSAKPVR